MKPTKQQILNCNDGQQLSDWVAEYCYGWEIKLNKDEPVIIKDNGDIAYSWQPHLPTEQGKAQCWDLADKYKIVVTFGLGYARTQLMVNKPFESVADKSIQIAVLKACLLSEIEG